MEAIEKRFNVLMLKNGVDFYNNKKFKKEFQNYYKNIIKSVTEIVNEGLTNELMVLEKFDISRVTKAVLKEGVRNNFIFCGVFRYAKKRVLLLEKIDTIGTYMLEDANLCRQLENLKIGIKIGLTRNEIGIDMVLPYEIKEGLFDS